MRRRHAQSTDQVEKTASRLRKHLATLTESASKLSDVAAQVRLWEKSKGKKYLERMQKVLLDEEKSLPEGGQYIAPGLERALSLGVFDEIASYGQLDRPFGLMASVLRFYSSVLSGLRKQSLFPNIAFHTSVTCLLLTISENLKKGQHFYRIEKDTLDFIQAISEQVQTAPYLVEFLITREKFRDEYLLVPILTHYFRQPHLESEQQVRSALLLCLQLEKREVLQHLLSSSDFVSTLVYRLEVAFSTLPENLPFNACVPAVPVPALAPFLDCCEFMDEVCEKCLFQDLLQSLGTIFQFQFCDKVLLTRAGPRNFATSLYYLARVAKVVKSQVILLAISSFLVGKRTQQANREADTPRSLAKPSHLRQFQSYDAMMYSTGHRKNMSSTSTAIETPTKTTAMPEIPETVASPKNHGRQNLVAQSGDYGSVLQTFLTTLGETEMSEGKRMCLLLLRNLVKKGNTEVVKTLFTADWENAPKQDCVIITKEEFLRQFGWQTCERVKSALIPQSFYRAIREFSLSDPFSPSKIPQVRAWGYTETIAESFYSSTDPENDFPVPEAAFHERQGTTIIHDGESPAAQTQPTIIRPSVTLTTPLKIIENMTEEDVKDVKMALAIVDGLCRYPCVDEKLHWLFAYLVEAEPGFRVDGPNLSQILSKLSAEFDGKLPSSISTLSISRSTSPVMARRKPGLSLPPPLTPKGCKVIEFKEIRSENATEGLLDKVRLFDKFLARLYRRIEVWEAVNRVRESCSDAWIAEVRTWDV